MQASALIVEVPEAEPLIGGWRARHDPVAARGVPAHITVLYPFREPATIDDAVIDRVSAAVSAIAPFEFTLPRLAEFPGVVYLQPEPLDPFRELTLAMWHDFPDCPPYGGRFDEIRPHLTVAQLPADADGRALRDQIEAATTVGLPIGGTATAVTLFCRDDDGWWSRQRRFSLRQG